MCDAGVCLRIQRDRCDGRKLRPRYHLDRERHDPDTAYLVLPIADQQLISVATARTEIDEMVAEWWYCSTTIHTGTEARFYRRIDPNASQIISNFSGDRFTSAVRMVLMAPESAIRIVV